MVLSFMGAPAARTKHMSNARCDDEAARHWSVSFRTNKANCQSGLLWCQGDTEAADLDQAPSSSQLQELTET